MQDGYSLWSGIDLLTTSGTQDAAEGVSRLSVFESVVQSLWKRSMVRLFVSMETYLGTY